MRFLPFIFYVIAVLLVSGAWALVIHYGDKPKEKEGERERDLQRDL